MNEPRYRMIMQYSKGQTDIQYRFDPDGFREEKLKAYQAALHAARNGEDFAPYLRTMHEQHLLELRYRYPSSVSSVRIKTADIIQACESCCVLKDRVFSLSEQIDDPILPTHNCSCLLNHHYPDTQGFCRCYYLPIFDHAMDEGEDIKECLILADQTATNNMGSAIK